MKFYNQQHNHYCGIDLHARKMYVCIINHKGKVRVHQNIKTDPELFFELNFPYLDDVAVVVECVFCWYWLADFCAQHHIPFILGHALYMKAIRGGKTKNDKSKALGIFTRKLGRGIYFMLKNKEAFDMKRFFTS